eukprot:365335-Chlamydomonas_euryale.AAC.2
MARREYVELRAGVAGVLSDLGTLLGELVDRPDAPAAPFSVPGAAAHAAMRAGHSGGMRSGSGDGIGNGNSSDDELGEAVDDDLEAHSIIDSQLNAFFAAFGALKRRHDDASLSVAVLALTKAGACETPCAAAHAAPGYAYHLQGKGVPALHCQRRLQPDRTTMAAEDARQKKRGGATPVPGGVLRRRRRAPPLGASADALRTAPPPVLRQTQGKALAARRGEGRIAARAAANTSAVPAPKSVEPAYPYLLVKPCTCAPDACQAPCCLDTTLPARGGPPLPSLVVDTNVVRIA